MPYTASGLRSKNNLSFGPLVTDQNRIGITGGNFTVSQDATGTPVVSPLPNANNTALTVPANAIAVNVCLTLSTSGSTPSFLQIGEDSSYAQGIQIPQNTVYTYPCARQSSVYLKTTLGTSAVGTISFQFICV